MPTLDIFNDNAFSLAALTDTINKMPFLPKTVESMGIFESEGIYTTSLFIEEVQGQLYLVPDTQRGAPPLENTRDPRKLRNFRTLHLPVHDHIMADEIQNKRAFGTENEFATAESEVNRRMVKMRNAIETTIEYGRVGALQGLILDADGSTIYNLYTEFGVSQQTVDFVLGTTTTSVLDKCMAVRADIQTALGGDGGDEMEVVALCGPTFFQELITHPDVEEAYKYYQQVGINFNPLTADLRYKGFTFGGITFKVYRGTVGGQAFIPASDATAFPVNVPNLYKTYYSPADYMETANTEGLPFYAKMAPDPMFNKFWELEVQSNPISIAKRPDSIIALTTSN